MPGWEGRGGAAPWGPDDRPLPGAGVGVGLRCNGLPENRVFLRQEEGPALLGTAAGRSQPVPAGDGQSLGEPGLGGER